MKDLRLVELYPSVQGEGPRTGEVTTFVRFAGCNMRCPGWPCDTQHAIQPHIWAKESWKATPEDVVAQIMGMPGNNICITGGEPTQQPAEPLMQLAHHLFLTNYTIDLFTNGSLVKLPEWTVHPSVTVILDWKLEGSGEDKTGVELRWENTKALTEKDAVKFVIASDRDYEEATALWKAMQHDVSAGFWAGVAWSHYKESELIRRIMKDDLPWRVNVQTHKFIWPTAERGI